MVNVILQLEKFKHLRSVVTKYSAFTEAVFILARTSNKRIECIFQHETRRPISVILGAWVLTPIRMLLLISYFSSFTHFLHIV